MKSDTHHFVKFMAVMYDQWLVLLIQNVIEFIINSIYFISLPLKAEIGKILSSVNPVSDRTLYTEYDWD